MFLHSPGTKISAFRIVSMIIGQLWSWARSLFVSPRVEVRRGASHYWSDSWHFNWEFWGATGFSDLLFEMCRVVCPSCLKYSFFNLAKNFSWIFPVHSSVFFVISCMVESHFHFKYSNSRDQAKGPPSRRPSLPHISLGPVLSPETHST